MSFVPIFLSALVVCDFICAGDGGAIASDFVSEYVYQTPHLQCKSSEDKNFDKSECRKIYYNESYRQQCESIAEYHIQGKYRVDCHYNYHHYNSSAHLKSYEREKVLDDQGRREIRIGGFNLSHPVNGKSLFKDLPLVAEIVDREFDLMAGIELIPTTSKQFQHNNRISAYLRYYREFLRTMDGDEGHRAEILANMERARFSYIVPGYIKILEQLRKRDPNWALMLSPRAESRRPRDQKEFVGYYYRASLVRPVPNKFCSQEVSLAKEHKYQGKLYACVPWFDKRINKAFSRRPFIADFKSGNFHFTMVSSHVVFNSPPKSRPEQMANVLIPAFNVSSYEVFPWGKGIDGSNYARWAEVKLTLQLMQTMRQHYGTKNIIYVADFNLEKRAALWEDVLKAFPGGQVYVGELTSLALTSGYASNYDHFIFDPSQTTRCVQRDGQVAVGRIDFFTTDYIVNRIARDDYTEMIWQNFIAEFNGKWQTSGVVQSSQQKSLYVIKRPPSLKPYRVAIAKYRESFHNKIIHSEKEQATQNLYINVLSDHVPVYLRCKVN